MERIFYRYIFLITVFTIFSSFGFSQDNILDKFLRKSYQSVVGPIPYRLFVPDYYNTDKAYPLVLTLHGSDDRGTDNTRHISHRYMATCWADSSFQRNHPCFILSPQCPENTDWGSIIVRSSVLEILDTIMSEYNIDTNRIYITGLSMGGYGTWNYLFNRPGLFAAAMPICGGFGAYIEDFYHVPFWNHHGTVDAAVPVAESRTIISAYEALGLPVVRTDCYNFICNPISKASKIRMITDNVDYIYSEYKGVDHNAWDYAYTDSVVLEWMFSKRRRIKDIITINEAGEYLTIGGNYSLLYLSDIDSSRYNVLFSNDLGFTWEVITEDSAKIDSTVVNTLLLPDSPFGIFKVQLQDSAGGVYGTDYSYFRRIDNPGNGMPFLKYYPSKDINYVSDDSISFYFLAGDAEEDQLELSVYYRQNDQSLYKLVKSINIETMPVYQEKYIQMNMLGYGSKARLKFSLSDGELSVEDSTETFKNYPRNPVIGIQEPINSGDILVYPNPSEGMINICYNMPLSGPAIITITDLSGRTVYRDTLLKNQTEIDLHSLSKSMYIIHIQDRKNLISKKLLLR